MRSTGANFITEKNKGANSPIFLYTIFNYDGSNNNLYYAEWDTDIVYGGVTYTKFPIAHEFTSENTTGQIDTLRITVSNVNRVLQAYLEAYELRGKKVEVLQVWASQLADATAYLKDTYYIDTLTATQDVVVFELSGKFDVLDFELPGRRYARNYCTWKFKSTECGYAGAETTCNRTLGRCRVLSNQARFGGFPSIPQRKAFGG